MLADVTTTAALDTTRAAAVPDGAPGADVRTTAVLAVLAGVEVGTVAGQLGIAESVLERWVQAFVTAGQAAVGAATPEPDAQHRERHLGLVAHELRSPLTMIQGWVDILRQPGGTQGFQQHALDAVEAQVDRLRRLADDALDATGVALGQLPLQVDERSLAEVVERIVAVRSGMRPTVTVLDDSTVALDYARFGQVLDNLLDNARKHAAGTPEVTVGRRGAYAEVVVSSPGDPIPREVAAMMFEPFERGSTGVEGVGLGLYVCRSLTVAHGGQIGLRVDDEGNHFWIRLPLIPSDADTRIDIMTYELACGDVMPGCATTFTAPDRDELMAEIARHAQQAHGIVAITPDVADAVERNIRTS